MKKTVILLICLLVLSLATTIYYHLPKKDNSFKENKVFQGPVPEGYDEEHFRKTGETIKEVLN
jgi:hypothetical protein